MITMTATDANSNFSELLQNVAHGEHIIIMSDGKPVAKVSPVGIEQDKAAAKERLLLHLSQQEALNQPKWTRDELYVR